MKNIKHLINSLIISSICCVAFSQSSDTLFVYPNPFSESATIIFNLDKEDTISLNVFNTIGKVVKSFYKSKLLAKGEYSNKLLGDSLPDGIYFVKLDIGSKNSVTKKIIKNKPTTSIPFNHPEKSEIIFYPNPTKNHLTIPLDGIKKIVVINTSGEVVKSIITEKQEISLNELSSGYYIVSIFDKNNQKLKGQGVYIEK
ncbi:MAG: hypothetical protein ACJAZ3_000635 [Sphingobacteriales bacterium]|jgi:hypothetical protein